MAKETRKYKNKRKSDEREEEEFKKHRTRSKSRSPLSHKGDEQSLSANMEGPEMESDIEIGQEVINDKSNSGETSQSSIEVASRTKNKSTEKVNIRGYNLNNNKGRDILTNKKQFEQSKTRIEKTFQYEKSDKSPFVVQLSKQRNNLEVNDKPILALEVARILFRAGIKYDQLAPISKRVWEVTFHSRDAANQMLRNKFLQEWGYNAFVPFWKVFRKGVIKDIPIDFEPELITTELNNGNPGLNVVESVRLKRRVKERGNVTWEDTTSVQVTMRIKEIPNAVYFWKTRIGLSPFIPAVRKCYRCGKVGHSIKFCKEEEKCLRCGNNKHDEENGCMLKCINCKGSHFSLDSKCPKLRELYEISRIIAEKNVSFPTARDLYFKRHFNAQENLRPSVDSLNFPVLGNENRFLVHNIRRDGSYRQAVSGNIERPKADGKQDSRQSNLQGEGIPTELNSEICSFLHELKKKEDGDCSDRLFRRLKELVFKIPDVDRFCQWNCCSIKRKLPELQYRASNFDVMLLSETWLTDDDSISVKGFDVVRRDRVGRPGGGVAILVRNNIKYKRKHGLYNCNNNIELCAIELFTCEGPFLVVSCYRPPDRNMTKDQWVRFLNQFSGNFLVTGDFNAHHQVWGSDANSIEGTKLFEAIEESEVGLLNGAVKTFYSRQYRTESALDLSFASCGLLSLFEWKVSRDTWGSDHFPIFIDFDKVVEKKGSNHAPKRLYNSKTDWGRLVRELEFRSNEIRSVVQNEDLEIQVKYTTFTAIIEDCVNVATPGRGGSRNLNTGSRVHKEKERRKAAIFWNSECDKLVRLRVAAFLRLKEYPSEENFLKYKQAEARAKSGIRKIKKDYFRSFLNSINKFTSPSYIWKKLKALKKGWNSSHCSNEFSEEVVERVKVGIDSLCPSWVARGDPMLENVEGDVFLDLPITVEELEVAIENSRTKSSPGLDGIDYLLIQSFPKEVRGALLELYNSIFASGIFPNEWRQYSIFFIPKSQGNAVRPISLAPCLLKILEKILNLRISWWLEFHNKFPETQFGFRRSKSCLDNLAILNAEILRAFDKKQCVGALFLDIRSAYDNVLGDVLLSRLISVGWPKLILKFVHNLVSERVISVKYDTIDCHRKVFRGLPQGSVLSPVLYSVYMMSLESWIVEDCKILQFADDVCIYAVDKDPKKVLKAVSESVHKIIPFLNDSGLELAPEKCQLIVFSSDPKIATKSWCIKINRERIWSQQVIKFLGILFHSSLKWDHQVQAIRSKCINPMAIINYLRLTWTGADPPTLIKVYKSLVRSRIEYGAFLFVSLKKSLLKVLDRIQNKALRLAMGYRNSTPLNVIAAESKEPPLEFRFRYMTHNFLTRCFSNSNHKVIAILSEISELRECPTMVFSTETPGLVRCFQEIEPISHLISSDSRPNCFKFPFQSMFVPAKVHWEEGKEIQEIHKSKPLSVERSFWNLFREEFRDAVVIFTDGSKTIGKEFVGFAYLEVATSSVSLNRTVKYASIFSAEAMAIIAALKKFANTDLNKLVIFSDSLSVLKALASIRSAGKLNVLIGEIKHLVYSLQVTGRVVKFFWIPAHVGISYNEKVDSAAKDSVMKGRDSQILLPSSDFKAFWKGKMHNDFVNWCKCEGLNKGRFYHENYYSESALPWFGKFNLARKPLVSINRLRCNHSSLKESLARFNIIRSAICECGEAEETANHVFFQCSKYEDIRALFCKDLRKQKSFPPYCIESMLHSMDRGVIFAVARFLNSIELSI
ncbi:uncharacterized protein [Chelonus insularis]|uniref:uncharacterized protein isoform X1 n=1 Tax=Chelonus insularis TaxID=460826 RepID=UPI00158AAFCF|nr:uncharacterized protein LOC118065086 isoform X1 [Chelonus insularis]